MISTREAVEKAKAGTTKLYVEHSGVAIACAKSGEEVTFKPSFPKDCPALSEQTFMSNYYGKRFTLDKPAEPKPPKVKDKT